MSEVILCNLSDSVSILEQKRKEWVCDISQALGYGETDLDFNDVSSFRSELNRIGVHIELKSSGEEIDVYKCEWREDKNESGWLPISKKHLIAQWKKPKYIRKRDEKGMYYELHINEWSMLKSRK